MPSCLHQAVSSWVKEKFPGEISNDVWQEVLTEQFTSIRQSSHKLPTTSRSEWLSRITSAVTRYGSILLSSRFEQFSPFCQWGSLRTNHHEDMPLSIHSSTLLIYSRFFFFNTLMYALLCQELLFYRSSKCLFYITIIIFFSQFILINCHITLFSIN